MEIQVGDIVSSLAGRDRGEAFLVVGEMGRFVLLADGKGPHLPVHPKRKTDGHLSRICACRRPAAQQLQEGGRATNSEIRKALAEAVPPGRLTANSNLRREQNLAKDDVIELEGTVIEALPNAMFQVELPTGTKSWRIFRASCA